jgi:hypothetical protein
MHILEELNKKLMVEITLDLESLASSETAPSSGVTSESESESEEREERHHILQRFNSQECSMSNCFVGNQNSDSDPLDQGKLIPPRKIVTFVPLVANSVDLIAAACELAGAF